MACPPYAWLGQASLAFAAKEEEVKLKWSQLGEVVTGKKATVALTDGSILEGRIKSIAADLTELSMSRGV